VNASSLALFIFIYLGLFCGLLWYWLRLILSGPGSELPIPLAATRAATVPALLQEKTP